MYNMTYRYEALANELEGAIRKGVFPIGSRLPSIRETCRRHEMSMATVMEAYARLEDQGLIEPRPKSGYYVKRPVELRRLIASSRPRQQPGDVSVSRLAMEILESMSRPGMAPLGAGIPNEDMLPVAELARCHSRAARLNYRQLASYEQPNGAAALRDAVAQIFVAMGCSEAPDDIVISNGGQEALMLALRATTRAQDVVAVESPVYFGVLQALEALDLQALELPTHPRDGVDLGALETAARSGDIQACILSPTYQNPLGFRMADPEKQRIVELLARYGIVLIEDDVFGELGLETPRPRPAKAFDTAGNVIFCSSFSKTVSPGMRLGWLAPGRFREEILRQKFLMNISSPVIAQLAMADFLKGNRYRRVTQAAARRYAQRLQIMRDTVIESFPDGTTCSAPVGGFFLWVEMPGDYDAMALYSLALRNDITFSPGRLFARANGYQSALRLNAAAIGREGIPEAVTRLGRLTESCRR